MNATLTTRCLQHHDLACTKKPAAQYSTINNITGCECNATWFQIPGNAWIVACNFHVVLFNPPITAALIVKI